MSEPVDVDIDYAEEARQFMKIQVVRYLKERPSRGFSSPAEYDAVLEMIRDAWVELRSAGTLSGLSSRGREAVYWTTLIFFPSFVAEGGLKCIPVDFVSRRRVGGQIVAAPNRPALERH